MSIFRSHSTLVGAVALAALALSAAPAMGQLAWQSYSAKFVCGGYTTPPPAKLTDGRYKTIINIHNPNYLMDPAGAPVAVGFLKKIVLSVPQGQDPLPPSCFFEELLPADHAMQVDCAAIKSQLALSGLPSAGGIEGFVVLMVTQHPVEDNPIPPLDVVAVYAARPAVGEVATMDVERVPLTQVIGEPPLDLCPND